MALMMNLALAAQLLSLADLRRDVEAFAQSPAVIDARLQLPACAAPHLEWASRRGSVRVVCAAPAWQIYVPVTVPPSAPQLSGIRRGDRVVVEAGGPGYSVALEAVALADARDGRVALQALGQAPGGRRMIGIVDAEGRVWVNGLSAVVNRR